MTSASSITPATNTAQDATRGRFVWYDLTTTDLPAATAFYAKVAGWGTQDFDMGPAGTYQMWTAGGAPIGGAVAIAPEMGPIPPHWMASVAVPSVDDTVSQAVSLGGSVTRPPADIPNTGRYGSIADPQGAMVGLYTSLTPTPLGDYNPKVGEFSWHELLTTDHEAAFSFYSALFGWETMSEFDMGPPVGTYRIFGHKGTGAGPDGNALPYGGSLTMTPEMRAQTPPCWVYYIRVPSVEDTIEVVKASGGQVIMGPMEVPGGDRIAQCIDPQGAFFALHATKL